MASRVVHFVRQIIANSSVKGFGTSMKKLSVVSATEGHCRCELTVGEEHTNRAGTVHGGFTAQLVDEVTTLALLTKIHAAEIDNQVITSTTSSVNLNMTYMSAARSGDTLVIDAQTDRAGNTLAFLSATITQKDSGKIVASGMHTKFIQRR